MNTETQLRSDSIPTQSTPSTNRYGLSSTITWKLASTYHSAAGGTCEMCGHAIKEFFYVRSSTGTVRIVGSECVKQIITDAASLTTAEKRIARFKRAASQWRTQTPTALPNESREQYINRRMVEMSNAWNAYCAMLNAPRSTWNGKGVEKINAIVVRYLKAFQQHDAYALVSLAMFHYECTKHRNRVMDAFARKHGANAFDFTNRRANDVKKL